MRETSRYSKQKRARRDASMIYLLFSVEETRSNGTNDQKRKRSLRKDFPNEKKKKEKEEKEVKSKEKKKRRDLVPGIF